jgi:hypothetical protein
MDSISLDQLQEILARCTAATPGPWESIIEGRDQTSGSSFIQTAGEDIYLSGATIPDQDFIASTRQDIPKLVHEILTLRGWSL